MQDFALDVLKLIAAEIYFVASMDAAREMYGKSYFSLGVAEKAAVDQSVWSHISGNLAGITPQLFAAQTPAPTNQKGGTGFQVPETQATEQKSLR